MQIPITGNADANGNLVLTSNDVQAGLMRVIAQISVECITAFRVGATCVIRRNDRFLTSTPLASGDTAYKEPYVVQESGDVISGTFAGFKPGDNICMTIFCQQMPWSDSPPTNIVI